MGVSGIPPGARMLGGETSVSLEAQRIIIPNATVALPNGLAIDGCDMHLLIVDVPHREGWRVPLSVADAIRFRNNIDTVLDGLAGNLAKGG